MVDTFDEFSFLPAQAAAIGIDDVPAAARLRMSLADGRTLSAVRYGAEPPQVTLLHGAGLNAHTWDTTVLALGLPVLAIDLAGHGDSSWRADADYSARTLAQDVVEALRTWTDRPQLLVGHSLGALTAAAVAAAAPELVDDVVLIDITPGVDPSAGPSQIRAFFAGPTDWASRDELVDRALAFGLGGSREAATRGVFLNSRVRADGRVEWKHHFAHLAAAASAAPPAAAPATAPPAPTGWDDLTAITAGLTLIRGERGFVTPEDAAEFAARLPAASVLVVATGHNVQEEIPRELAAILRAAASGSADGPLAG